jgi:hypothetical protein
VHAILLFSGAELDYTAERRQNQGWPRAEGFGCAEWRVSSFSRHCLAQNYFRATLSGVIIFSHSLTDLPRLADSEQERSY